MCIPDLSKCQRVEILPRPDIRLGASGRFCVARAASANYAETLSEPELIGL